MRVLGTLEYPGAESLQLERATPEENSFLQRPKELARIVSWLEDRKVGRGWNLISHVRLCLTSGEARRYTQVQHDRPCICRWLPLDFVMTGGEK